MPWHLFKLLCTALLINIIKCELLQLNAFIRHGERTPTETYSNDPYLHYNWTEGWGSLTNRGKLDMYEFGQKFRETYKDFIPVYYWPDDVNVTSSYSQRVRASAYLFCAGLYPPKGVQIWNTDLLWQPVPLTYQERSKDTIIVMRAECPKYDQMFKDVQNSAKVKDILSNNKNLLEYLTEHTGDNVTTVEDVELLYNTLEIEQLHNLTLPAWINDTILVTMRELAAINLALYSETEYMKRVKGGMFLKTVFSNMDKALSGQKTRKLNFFFGHDLSLVHIMRSLNLADVFKPGFGAYLIFELYSDSQIKIIYSDSDKGPILVQKNFELSAFKQSLIPVLPDDYDTECQLDT